MQDQGPDIVRPFFFLEPVLEISQEAISGSVGSRMFTRSMARIGEPKFTDLGSTPEAGKFIVIGTRR